MLVGSVLGYAALFFILRYMPGDYGIIGFAMAYVGLFGFIAGLGFDSAHVKRISEGKDLDKCIGTYFVVKLVLTTIMVVFVVSSIQIWKFVIGRGFETPEHEITIYIFLVYAAILSMSSVALNTYSARRETAKQQVSTLMEPVTRVPLAIIVALGSFGVIALAGSYVFGAVALLIMSLLLFRGYPFGKFDSAIFKSYFKFAIPLAVSSGIIVISSNIDKVMLQLFMGKDPVEYYFGVQMLTRFIITMSMAVTLLLFPTLSEHHGKEEHSKVRKLTAVAERYVSMIVIPIAVFLIVFSEPILYVFRSDIAKNAAGVLRILTIYSVIICFYSIFINQIMAVDKPKLGAKIGVSMALINILLNIVLIPKDIKSLGINLFGMGAEGAALATAISAIYGLIMVKIYTRKLTGTKWNPRILIHLGCAVVMGVTLYYISSALDMWDWFTPEWGGVVELAKYVGLIALTGILGLGIYIGLLWLLKEFTKDDLKLFLNLLSPLGMRRYVFSELRGKENDVEKKDDVETKKEDD